VVLVGVAVLASVPPLVAAMPVAAPEVAASDLLAKVRASGPVAYQGYAESRAGLGLPDVPRTGRVVALLGETTRMRAWVRGPAAWRVDELTLVGERGTYQDEFGTWQWDSGARRADRTEGEPPVRFARPADLLPPELGRRLATAAARTRCSGPAGAGSPAWQRRACASCRARPRPRWAGSSCGPTRGPACRCGSR